MGLWLCTRVCTHASHTVQPKPHHSLQNSLPRMLHVQVTVVRQGRSREIDVRDLLVGDVLCFGAGDILPADGLIFASSDVRYAHKRACVTGCE